MDASPLSRDAVLRQLDKVLSSSIFRRVGRSSALLKYIVERGLDGQTDRLKEYTLGAEALGRGESFDPRTDPVVRAEASRLRTRLDQYYDLWSAAVSTSGDGLKLEAPAALLRTAAFEVCRGSGRRTRSRIRVYCPTSMWRPTANASSP